MQPNLMFANRVVSALQLRGFTVTQGTASDGAPTILVGAGTAGSQSAFVKIAAVDFGSVNAFGLALNSPAPFVAQLVLETSTIANVSLLTGANLLPIVTELVKPGVRVELYMSANTNAPEASDIVVGNLKLVLDPSIETPLG